MKARPSKGAFGSVSNCVVLAFRLKTLFKLDVFFARPHTSVCTCTFSFSSELQVSARKYHKDTHLVLLVSILVFLFQL